MAKITLKQKLNALTHIILGFVGITNQKDSKGKSIAILQLSEAIPMVRGSQEFEIDGTKRPLIATEVMEIKIHEDDFNDDLVWDDETDTGTYDGSDLVLDVSQGGQVWLRAKSFAQGGQEYRSSARQERLRKALGVAPVKEGTTEKMTPVDTTV